MAVILIVLLLTIIAIVSRIFYKRISEEHCLENAKASKVYAEDILVYVDYDHEEDGMNANTEFFIDRLRLGCKMVDAKYMYLFKADIDTGEVVFYAAAALDDEENEVIIKERRTGTVVNDMDMKYLKQALEGDISEPEKFTNKYGSVYTYYYTITPIYYTPEGEWAHHDPVFVGIDFDVGKIQKEAYEYVMKILLVAGGVLSVAFGLLLIALRWKIFVPIKQISEEMNNFDPENESRHINVKSYEEIQEIAGSFNRMSDDIHGYIKSIQTLADEKAQASAELSIARSIQEGMVPAERKYKGDVFDVYALSRPMKEVGGDFYNWFEKDGKLYFLLADVSGKGVAAALFMSMTLVLISEKLKSEESPAAALNAANDEICLNNPEEMFVTIFAGDMDMHTGEVRFANAGHTRPVLINGQESSILDPDAGIALGMFEDAGIKDDYIILEPGQGILVYTDGVTEAVSKDRKLYGEKRLLEAVKACREKNITESICADVDAFSRGCEQADDITMLSFCFTGASVISRRIGKGKSSFTCLKDILTELTGDVRSVKRILLACEEICVNVERYSGSSEIFILASKKDDILSVRIEDDGTYFDPTISIPEEKEFEDYENGGMGIRLVMGIAESVKYSRIRDKNILVMRFKLWHKK